MAKRDIVVIGGSAGAAPVIADILQRLPADYAASVFVTVHFAPTSRAGWLERLFAEVSPLRVVSPQHEDELRPATVYVARPDRHLMVKEGRVLMGHGPRENMWRPAIDVLFRSAAVAYSSRVVGVLTSGELDDGTSGLQAIKACGGITIVQKPQDAVYPAMLRTALANVPIDHSVPALEIASLLAQLSNETAPAPPDIPVALRKEARMVETPEDAPALMRERGSPEPLNCPECGGPLWRDGPDAAHLRCLVGHAYHLRSLAQDTDAGIDRTLWAAIRMFEQRAHLSRMLADQERDKGRGRSVRVYEDRADEAQRHANTLRELHGERHFAEEEPQE